MILAVITSTAMYAQEAPAQSRQAERLPPAIEKKVTVNASVEDVWKYLSNISNYQEYANTKESRSSGSEMGTEMMVKSQGGNSRKQVITANVEQLHRVSFKVIESDYKLEKPANILFEVKKLGTQTKCEVVLSVYYGFNELPAKAKTDLTQELENISKALAKKFP